MFKTLNKIQKFQKIPKIEKFKKVQKEQTVQKFQKVHTFEPGSGPFTACTLEEHLVYTLLSPFVWKERLSS